ncbi:MAG: hypothetical protein LYZ70_03420 [Nitrososphaerales archaeon]|nr:hypothetical protein [Nitrososphaerales archaeon]
MVESAAGWLKRILLPRFGELKGEVKAVKARIGGSDGKMLAEFGAVHPGIMRLDDNIEVGEPRPDGSMGTLGQQLDWKMDDLDKLLDVVQGLATLEEKAPELQGKN